MAEVRVLEMNGTSWGVRVRVDITVDDETLEIEVFSGDPPRHKLGFEVSHRGVQLVNGELATL